MGAIMATLAPNQQSIPLNVVGSNKFGRYAKISTESTYNMFISDNALMSYAGYRAVLSVAASGQARQIFTSEKLGDMIVVMGNQIYGINQYLGLYKIGNMASSSGNVYIAENQVTQIALVDGQFVYVWDWMSNAFTKVTVDFSPGYISYFDGRFIAADVNSATFRISAFMPSGATSWPSNSQSVGELQSKPDYCKAVVAFNKQILVFGRTLTEIWYDVGYQLFPLQQNNYYYIDYGCINAASIALGTLEVQSSDQQVENDLVPICAWVGVNKNSGPVIMYTIGSNPRQISTDGINLLLENLQFPDQCYGFMYRQAGHTFYHITWNKDNLTLLYDFNARKFYYATDENLNYHIARNIALLNNKYYFISLNDTNIYQLSPNFEDQNGKQMQCWRTMSPIRNRDGSRFIIQSVNLNLQQGDSSYPQRVDLSLSVDSGNSWGTIIGNELNPIGTRPNRLQYWNLGAANDATIRLHFVGKGRFVVVGGEAIIYQ
jgi:hypothetical protein